MGTPTGLFGTARTILFDNEKEGQKIKYYSYSYYWVVVVVQTKSHSSSLCSNLWATFSVSTFPLSLPFFPKPIFNLSAAS